MNRVDKPLLVSHRKDVFPIRKRILQLERKWQQARVPYQTFYRSGENGSSNHFLKELVELFDTPPFGVEVQLGVVWDYQKILSSKEVALLHDRLGGNHLFLVSVDLSRKKQLPTPVTRLPLLEYEFVSSVDYASIKERLKVFFAEAQLKLSADSLYYLTNHFRQKIEQVEDAESDPLKHDLDKLALFFRKGSLITLEKITDLIDELKEERNEFEVIEAFFSKEIPLTLSTFLLFLKNGGQIGSLINRFISELARLIQFKESLLEAKPLPQIYRELHCRFEVQRKALKKKNALFDFSQLLVLMDDFILLDQILKRDSLTHAASGQLKTPLRVKLAFERMVLLRLAR